ncbi:MAG: transposase [Eubacterium sp.]|nr:transposase [Eubacterium sp.]
MKNVPGKKTDVKDAQWIATLLLFVKRLCEKGALDERDVGECLKGTLRGKVSEVRLAVAGKLSEHDRIFLTNLVKVKENCDRVIEDVEQRITEYSEKYEPAMQALETIPAVQRRASAIIISELGVYLSMFQTAGHLCKWAGLCPGDNESAKKKKIMRITKGNRLLLLCLIRQKQY